MTYSLDANTNLREVWETAAASVADAIQGITIKLEDETAAQRLMFQLHTYRKEVEKQEQDGKPWHRNVSIRKSNASLTFVRTGDLPTMIVKLPDGKDTTLDDALNHFLEE